MKTELEKCEKEEGLFQMSITQNHQIIEINKIKERDNRKGLVDFYRTFEMEQFYSYSMFTKIVTGHRAPKKENFIAFVDNCLEVYKNDVKDYSKLTIHDLETAIMYYEKRHGYIKINLDLLAAELDVVRVSVNLALRNPQKGRTTASNICDILNTDLLVEKKFEKEKIFSNLKSLQTLKQILMRTMVGDGTRVRSIEEIAKITGIEIDTLQNLAIACKSQKQYLDTYNALIDSIEPYDDELFE